MMVTLLVKGGCGDHGGGSHTGDTCNEAEFHALVVVMTVLVTVVTLVMTRVIAEMTVTVLAVSMWQEAC